jgi:Protein of unknown function (DUF499)
VTVSLTPWWEVLRLRHEIVDASGSIDDVQMSLFQAVYGTPQTKPLYANAAYYAEITYPSPRFIELMAQVAVRLGGGANYTRAPALWRLDQAMGGGKSHGLIGLWHLATHPRALCVTDVGREAFSTAEQIVGQGLPADLSNPQVVVLSCDNMTAGKGAAEHDGPAATLYERFLWRLFGGDNALFLRYRDYNGDKSKLMEALTAVGRPVLILVDEIMDYVRQLGERDKSDLAVRDMAFLRALLDSVNDVPNVSMAIVMIASEHDSIALEDAAVGYRAELEQLLIRNAKTATINDNTDFAAILRRRLFETSAPSEVKAATTKAFADRMTGTWKDKVFSHLPSTSSPDFHDEVARCYPFHPQLMALAEQEWAKLAGFQKVRSTIRIFAATVFSQHQRGRNGEWAPLLIGPGDLPLSSSAVREAIIGSGLIQDTRTQANYRQIASADIVAGDDRNGSARLLDRNRADMLTHDTNPRAAERAATCLFLCSIVGSRGGGRQGATDSEVKAAMFVPDSNFAYGNCEAVLAELVDVESGGLASVEHLAGKGGQAPRYFLSTRQTLNMLFRSARATVTDEERDGEYAATASRLSVTGPFKTKLFVEADLDRSAHDVLATAGIDDARTTRLVVLDPRQFSLLNGIDQETRDALQATMGLGNERLPVTWASSAVFAVANTQRRSVARGAVTTYLAWDRVAGMNDVRADPELLEQAQREKQEARSDMDKAVKRSFQHVVYLAEGDDTNSLRVDRTITFEQENQSALDGAQVWKGLVEAHRAFDIAQFNARALLHNLLETDYGRPLDEVRDLFWSVPRMPLLPNGEADLQNAIFEAVSANKLRLVGADGLERAVTRPGDVGVGLSSLRLAAPQSLPETIDSPQTSQVGASGHEEQPHSGPHPAKPPQEVEVAFTLMTGLTDDAKHWAVYQLLDELSRCVDKDGSYFQATIRVILGTEGAERIANLAREAGSDPTTRNV